MLYRDRKGAFKRKLQCVELIARETTGGEVGCQSAGYRSLAQIGLFPARFGSPALNCLARGPPIALPRPSSSGRVGTGGRRRHPSSPREEHQATVYLIFHLPAQHHHLPSPSFPPLPPSGPLGAVQQARRMIFAPVPIFAPFPEALSLTNRAAGTTAV